MHANTPKTERLIATLLEKHKNCPVKGHILIVTDDKRILLKHRKELCASDIIIAKLNPKHIHMGLTARQWNDFSRAIIAVSETNNAGDITGTLFQ